MPSGEELEFTYNLGDNMKIDIEKAKLKKAEIEAQRKKEFEELKNKMGKQDQQTNIERSTKFTHGKALLIETPPNNTITKLDNDQDEEIEDFYEDVTD